jgi:osmotically-inducible protein OsmY
VQLKVTNGWVTLEGKTEWQFQREEAERVVRPLLGVKGITNEIRLTPNISIPTIKANIQRFANDQPLINVVEGEY